MPADTARDDPVKEIDARKARNRAQFEQQRTERAAAFQDSIEQAREAWESAQDEHADRIHERRRAERTIKELRRELDGHVDTVLAKIDERAALLPAQYQAALRASADRIIGSGFKAATLPPVAEIVCFLNAARTAADPERIEEWKAAVREAAEQAGDISTRAHKEIERDLEAAEEALSQALAAEGKALDAVEHAQAEYRKLEPLAMDNWEDE